MTVAMKKSSTKGARRLDSERENFDKLIEEIKPYLKKEKTSKKATRIEWHFSS
jgi:hypothetical protein